MLWGRVCRQHLVDVIVLELVDDCFEIEFVELEPLEVVDRVAVWRWMEFSLIARTPTQLEYLIDVLYI